MEIWREICFVYFASLAAALSFSTDLWTKMAVAVDVLQPFANDDLFDAELGADSDGGQNGNLSEEDSLPKSPARDWMEKQKDNNSDGEAANSSSEEETTLERRKKQKKREAKNKSPKPRKAKKAELMSMHSETQRMVRESTVRLPYHQPTVLPISHFLKRVPLTDHKETKSSFTKTAEKVVPSDIPHDDKATPSNESKPDDHDITNPLPGDTASPTGVVKGVKTFQAATPKLSAATDPFFLDGDVSATSKPVNSGVQSLRDRFMKHTSKPREKSVKPVETRECKSDEILTETRPKPGEGTPIMSDDKLKAATPGSRLQILREQLQAKMRVKRAENRKIQESQQRLDNEEVSEEEEEEEMTDEEEDDSDFELDKWNEDDERKQEEGESDLDEETKEKNAFVEDEAEESDNNDDDNNGYDIDSGSEGDISDGGESDVSDEKSAFSDDGLSKPTAKLKSKKKHKESKKSTLNIEDETMDLFCDSRSRCDSKGDSNDSVPKNSKTEKDSGESAVSLSLRLDSVEEGEESNFNFPSSSVSSKLKTKVSSKVVKSLMNISEVSQESSQSSFGDALGSEFGESVNSLEASSDSSRIPPGQGENNAQGNEEVHSGKKTPELFSSFSKLRNLIGIRTDGEAQSTKKPGKLSQLTLPIEDSQDLFDDESDRNTEDNFKRDGNRTEALSSDFHFSLDEDTQFTQILNTQGFINSSKKSKSKTNQLFDDDKTSDTQPEIKELLGLCSGRFSDSEDSKASKSAKPLDKKEKYQKGELFDTQSKQHNMDELLGLCTGKFTDDENEGEDDEVDGGEKDESDVELEEQEDRNEEEKEENMADTKSEEGDASDPEEMVLKRKFGKKYEAKKSIFDKRNFLEEEAELSGSDVGSDEDEDIATDDDVMEDDSGGEELPSDEELQKQINKVHMKSIHDQDNADLRAVKEMFLPDGDLYTDGQGRTRHFRWRGIDENSQLSLFGNKEMWGEEDGIATELSTEEEIQRRKERYEREAFLREEMSKKKSNALDIDESSQDILSKIKDTSSQLAEAPSKPQAMIVPNSSVAPVLKKKTSFKGSFLKHNKTTLSRLSSLTSNTPNASATTRGFVFQTVSPSGKNTINAKKMQRTNSVIEQPASKKPRLERSLSDSNQSVFSML